MVQPQRICYCLKLNKDFVKAIVELHSCQTYKEVQRHCEAGTRCGACVGEIQDLCHNNSYTKDTNGNG